jgi:hypothetical protein
MKDIPRNELLDKLAAGWKVRRKEWAMMACTSKNGGNVTVGWTELLENDWQGEPPEAKCLSGKLYIQAAFALLQDGTARFIRRPSWDKDKAFKHSVMCFALNYEDIQTSDWEVWG